MSIIIIIIIPLTTQNPKHHTINIQMKMAGVSANPLSTLSIPSIPKIPAKPQLSPIRINDICSTSFGVRYRNGRNWIKRLNAGLSEYEPDLREDPIDRWDNLGISDDDFVYGVYDGHHTYYEAEDKSTFWGSIKEDYEAINPPTGFQGLISWLFLPSVALGMYLNVPGEYLYIGAAIFIVIFCVIEMDKPSEAYNFEPQIYNMERGARDKLISDYNTMDIWDFNEKYGDLWDFTVTKDDIMKR
ncbi:putative photosynthetic NDH subunit of subcomplex B 5, chloroplastic protein [Helianthus debilis subsp. tardiflorus]